MDEFSALTVDGLRENMRAKFFGQVDPVLTGQHHCADGASFTLTSGVFGDLRVTVVSPAMVAESAGVFGGLFPVIGVVSVAELVGHYVECVEGAGSGRVVWACGWGRR
ncbi:hypothetical protein [Actinosynnema pretiosum]|uniref:Uncharacterized protein n=1 Tax=Actinosynnema pretiosum TaxID=42197 RepID=A0A290Z793_9PSEU|nr:hypothetical protein [Actinosynnema pretiosum]ATE54911.1 hypothetical protein CNX65_17820 [Actinosynnema pretiosum]